MAVSRNLPAQQYAADRTQQRRNTTKGNIARGTRSTDARSRIKNRAKSSDFKAGFHFRQLFARQIKETGIKNLEVGRKAKPSLSGHQDQPGTAGKAARYEGHSTEAVKASAPTQPHRPDRPLHHTVRDTPSVPAKTLRPQARAATPGEESLEASLLDKWFYNAPGMRELTDEFDALQQLGQQMLNLHPVTDCATIKQLAKQMMEHIKPMKALAATATGRSPQGSNPRNREKLPNFPAPDISWVDAMASRLQALQEKNPNPRLLQIELEAMMHGMDALKNWRLGAKLKDVERRLHQRREKSKQGEQDNRQILLTLQQRILKRLISGFDTDKQIMLAEQLSANDKALAYLVINASATDAARPASQNNHRQNRQPWKLIAALLRARENRKLKRAQKRQSEEIARLIARGKKLAAQLDIPPGCTMVYQTHQTQQILLSEDAQALIKSGVRQLTPIYQRRSDGSASLAFEGLDEQGSFLNTQALAQRLHVQKTERPKDLTRSRLEKLRWNLKGSADSEQPPMEQG